jgi:hypothetical protein
MTITFGATSNIVTDENALSNRTFVLAPKNPFDFKSGMNTTGSGDTQ